MTGVLSKPHPLSHTHRWLLKLIIIRWQKSMCYSGTVTSGWDLNMRGECCLTLMTDFQGFTSNGSFEKVLNRLNVYLCAF